MTCLGLEAHASDFLETSSCISALKSPLFSLSSPHLQLALASPEKPFQWSQPNHSLYNSVYLQLHGPGSPASFRTTACLPLLHERLRFEGSRGESLPVCPFLCNLASQWRQLRVLLLEAQGLLEFRVYFENKTPMYNFEVRTMGRTAWRS